MLTDLARKPISETIRGLAAERRSGDLQVISGKAAKMVFFDHGRVVFAGSNLKKERLGEALVSLGRITDQEFARASGLMKEDRKLRFGDALVQAGVMDKKQVGTSVARCVAKILLSLFKLDEGAASFEERKCTIPVEYMVSLSIHRLLRAGIMSMSSRELILAGVGDLGRSVKLAEVPSFTFAIDTCSAEEVDVLEKAKTRVTVRRLAWTTKGLSLSRLRIAYAFLASGILEEAVDSARAAVTRPVVQNDVNAFLLSPLQRTAEVAARPAIAAEVVPPASAEKSAHTEAPAVVAPVPTAPTPAPATSATPSGVDVSMEVERLIAQANVLLMVKDFSGALQAYFKVVELQPDVAAHRLRLAVALRRSSQTERQAERQFIEAVRLEPDNVELHYQFGLYYNALKVRSRAVAEFRTVVRLDPRHKLARRELEATSPNDSVLVTLKKLLG